MNIIKKVLMTLVICLSSTSIFAAETVKIGDPGWPGAKAIAHLLQAVVNDKIGGKAEIVTGNNAAIYGAIDRDKGEIQAHPDIWLPNQEGFTKKLVKGSGSGKLVMSSKAYEGNQGYCVSKNFAKKFNITSIFDLGRPEVVKAMDSDGNGKGEFWIGAPGWASANVNEIKVRDYKLLAAGIEPVTALETVKDARVKDSITKGEGYAFYCYKPHAIWSTFDIVMLTEPKHDPKKYVMVQPNVSPDWKKKSFVASKDALKQIQIGWSLSLEKQSPAIAGFFKRFQLTADEVGKLAYEISTKKRDPNEVAKEYIKNNSKKVNSWLGL